MTPHVAGKYGAGDLSGRSGYLVCYVYILCKKCNAIELVRVTHKAEKLTASHPANQRES